MPGEVGIVSGDKANADQDAPSQDIDLDSAAKEAERRLAGEVPVAATPAEEVKTDQAAQPATEEGKSPVAEPLEEGETVQEPTPDASRIDPEDHKERTKLGRKVAELGDTVGKLLEQNNLLLQQLAARGPQNPPSQAEPEPEYVDLSTPEGLERYLEQRERNRTDNAQRDKAQYAGGYSSQLKEYNAKATEDGDADATEIHKLLTGETPFNLRHSSDPKADFTLNLSKAEAHYYKQKAKAATPERKAPLQNATPRASLAVGGESKADAGNGASKPLRISAAAMEFAKAQGWSDEQVAAALSAPTSNSFVKGLR